jgi:hypothetical protein
VEQQKAVLTVKELSKEFGFPEYGIRGLIKRGAFPVIKCGNRCYVTRQVFEDYIKSGGELYGTPAEQ